MTTLALMTLGLGVITNQSAIQRGKNIRIEFVTGTPFASPLGIAVVGKNKKVVMTISSPQNAHELFHARQKVIINMEINE